jgi:anti-anti-sigma regulatory factor
VAVTDVRPTESPVVQIRAHTPIPSVSIVRPTGCITEQTAATLMEHLKMRLDTECDSHIVLDLQDVTIAGGLGFLDAARGEACSHGVTLHVTGLHRLRGSREGAPAWQLPESLWSTEQVIEHLRRPSARC